MNECTWFMNNSFNAHATFLQLMASLLDTALPKRKYNMANHHKHHAHQTKAFSLNPWA